VPVIGDQPLQLAAQFAQFPAQMLLLALVAAGEYVRQRPLSHRQIVVVQHPVVAGEVRFPLPEGDSHPLLPAGLPLQ